MRIISWHLQFYCLCLNRYRGWKAAAAVKSIVCSSREPRRESKHPHDISRPCVIPVPGHPTHPSDTQAHTWCIYICADKPTYVYKTKTSKLIKILFARKKRDFLIEDLQDHFQMIIISPISFKKIYYYLYVWVFICIHHMCLASGKPRRKPQSTRWHWGYREL